MTTETTQPKKTFAHFSWRGGMVTAAFWNIDRATNVQAAFAFCSPLDKAHWNRKLGNTIAGGRLEKGSKTVDVKLDPSHDLPLQLEEFLSRPENLTFIPRWAGGADPQH